MPKTYNLSTSFRAPKPRSKKLRGLYGQSSAAAITSPGDVSFASILAKIREMFVLVDAQGNEVDNVEDAVAVKVANGLSLLSEGEITAYVAPTTPNP